MKKVMIVFGTRPEAIKMAPLCYSFRDCEDFELKVLTTGQHTDLLTQVTDALEINVDYDLKIMKKGQDISYIVSSILQKLPTILEEESPDMVFVHGDTSTSFAAALAAFNLKIPVAHVEAGLRTSDPYHPFPEEMNRRLTGQLASIHFAPTKVNVMNLSKENIMDNVFLVGNTIVDAISLTVKENYQFHNKQLQSMDFQGKKYILVTAHRRENWGEPIANLCKVIVEIATEYENVKFVWPVHANPVIKDLVYSVCSGQDNIILLEPLDVFDTHNLISRCYMIVTDSGGIQEESVALGKPVLVFRAETERIEAVEVNIARLIGTKPCDAKTNIMELLDDRNIYEAMGRPSDVYGDGHATEYIVDYVRKFLND